MIPLHDDNPTALTPVVTIGLIAACSLAWLWQFGHPPDGRRQIVYALGVIPAVLLGDRALPPELACTPPVLTLLSSMFLHGGWMHLIGNMLSSEEHTSELQTLMRRSYTVFCLKKKTQ